MNFWDQQIIGSRKLKDLLIYSYDKAWQEKLSFCLAESITLYNTEVAVALPPQYFGALGGETGQS